MNFDKVQMMLPFVHDILEKKEQSKHIAEYYDRLKYEETVCPNNKQSFEENQKEINAIYEILKKDAHLSYEENMLIHSGDVIKIKRLGSEIYDYETNRKNSLYGYVTEQAQRIANCANLICNDTYEKQKTKVLKNIFLCKHMFCTNCQKQRQLSRLLKFGPELDKVAETHDLFHMVLTEVNCAATELKSRLAHFHKCAGKFLNLFIRQPRKDLKQLGCVAAVRSTEITCNSSRRMQGKEYHHHAHIIIALKKGFTIQKTETHPKYSYDFTSGKKKHVRYFSKLELELQKIWYLIINKQKINKTNLETVENGYSVILDPIDPTSYYEVFKYPSKPYDENKNPLSYEQYKTLFLALTGKRSIQGYGKFYNITADETVDESFHAAQEVITAFLEKTEEATRTYDRIDHIEKDMTEQLEYLYLNMKNIHNIGNTDLDEIKDMNSLSDISDLINKLKIKKEATAMQKRIDAYKRFFYQLNKRYPEWHEEAAHLLEVSNRLSAAAPEKKEIEEYIKKLYEQQSMF